MMRILPLFPLLALLAGPAGAAAQDTLRLSLEEAVGRAVEQAAGVRIAAVGIDESAAEVRQARAALLPRLDAGASWLNRSYNQASMGLEFPAIPGAPAMEPRVGPFDLWDSRLRVSQALFDPAAWTAVRAARLGERASGAERSVAVEAAAERAALAYVDALRSRGALAAREADLELARELVRLAAERVAAGAATPLDATRAEIQRLTAEGDRLAAENAAAKADLELALALGMDPGSGFALADSLSGLAAAEGALDPEAARARGIAARPELELERSRRDAFRAGGRAVRAERLPRVELFGDVGWNGTTPENLMATRQVGLQLSIPLLDGWRREGRIAEQEALAEQARLRERDLRGRVEAEVRGALLELSSARERGRVAVERLGLAQQELEQARARFREGVAGNGEVVEAQRTLVAARDAVIEAEHRAAVTRIRLARSTGDAGRLR